MPNIIDIFAGPGGLAEGFSSLLLDGRRRYNVRLSIEKDPIPHQTLKLRAFFRTFDRGSAPPEYYAFVAGRISIESLYEAYPQNAATADSEALQATLGECTHEWLDQKIIGALDGDTNWVLIGGPPCQAYSIAGIVGNRTKKTYCPTADPRYFLYKEYLRIVALHTPAVFVMENVKGLLMAKHGGQSIANDVINGLSNPAEFMFRQFGILSDAPRYKLFTLDAEEYTKDTDPNIFLVHCEKYGIPQARHRVIIIGVREDVNPLRLAPPRNHIPTPLNHVIGDLPKIRSAISRDIDSLALWRNNILAVTKSEWLREAVRLHDIKLGKQIRQTVNQIRSTTLTTGAPWEDNVSVPQWNANWYHDPRMDGISHHEARPHILADLQRYLFCSCFSSVYGHSPKMSDFPEELLPKHENAKSGHFKDRFRVQMPGKPASTIISHMNKDGHAFIHPDPTQCRSLTPREAARIQTFPDNYYFFGGRSHQYRQIGNAVPPWLARIIAETISAITTA
jgi:DNA (cytosine-5)-methyltransferase 1